MNNTLRRIAIAAAALVVTLPLTVTAEARRDGGHGQHEYRRHHRRNDGPRLLPSPRFYAPHFEHSRRGYRWTDERSYRSRYEGRIWIRGHYDPYGRWIPGHWRYAY
jgi:hypothetical protein